MEKEFIYNWFSEKGRITAEEIEKNLDVNYFDCGWIDSFAFLELLSACEVKFNIQFSDDDFKNNDFFTINGLIRLLKRK